MKSIIALSFILFSSVSYARAGIVPKIFKKEVFKAMEDQSKKEVNMSDKYQSAVLQAVAFWK